MINYVCFFRLKTKTPNDNTVMPAPTIISKSPCLLIVAAWAAAVMVA